MYLLNQAPRKSQRTRQIHPNSLQRTPHIQCNMLRDACESRLKVSKVDPVVDAAVSNNVDGKQAILVLLGDQGQNLRLVRDRRHRHAIVAGHESEVGEGTGPKKHALVVDIHGDVTHCDCNGTGVGDRDGTDHVGAVGFRG